MSFINKRTRVFKEAGDTEVQRKRSDGRMKTYHSSTDARAWCNNREQRRQHILDLVKQGPGKGLSLGKYIPIEAIIDILLANKNADIERLQQENDDLRDFIKKHGLAYQEKERPTTVAKFEKDGEDGEVGRPAVKAGTTRLEESAGRSDEASRREPDPVSGRGLEQISSKGLDQTSRRGPDQISSAGPDQVSSIKEPAHESPREATAGTISSKDSRPRTPGTAFDGKESVASKGSRGGETQSQMKDSISEVPVAVITEEITSDSGYEEDKDPPRYRRAVSPEDEKAAAEFLADKSPEEQIEALKRALSSREQLYQEQRDIAVAAIEKLENIRDIVEDTAKAPGKASGVGQKSRRDEENAELRTGKQMEPRDSWQQPGGSASIKHEGLDELRGECADLRRRLDNTDGIEEAIRRLKGKAHEEGDSEEKDKLLAKIATLEQELDNLKCKLREIEILKVERDCLKNRLEDLSRIRKDYEELLKKTQGFDALKAECAMYKSKCEELQNLEAECNELRVKVLRLDQLENERALLMKEIQDCECCMNIQDDEIKRLACHIECMNQDLDKRQDEMKVKMITMRAHLEKKENIIAKSEQELADVQSQLHSSIESLACETSCLRIRIEELEDEVKEYEDKLKQYQNIVTGYENKLTEFQMNLESKEENNKALLEKLENEKNTSEKLEEELKNAIKVDEHLKQLMKQVKLAILCITRNLAKHELVDVAKMLAEKENYDRKIKELNRMANCEAGGANLETNQLIEELQNELASLKFQLEKERKFREQMQVANFGDADFAKLRN